MACLLLSAVTTLLAAGCARRGDRAAGASHGGKELRPTRGVLLISLDTLRADHLGAYGYKRDTSPFIDSLAARGVVFEHAYSQYPSTLTSHMTIFTGLYPGEHRVYPPDAILSPEITTLPMWFQKAGYATGGFTEGAFVSGRFGFDRGFDSFNDEALRKTDDIERTMQKALRFLDGLQSGQKFFLFFHSYEIHDPYDPPQRFVTRFWDQPVPDTIQPNAPDMVRYNVFGGDLDPVTVPYFKALYDASIAYADDAMRRFFAALAKRGLTDDLTVILLSDHGEQFLEHGQFVHGDLYHEVMHVPLIVLHPDLKPRRVQHPVELADVAPTLAALAHIETGADPSGRSLVPDLSGTQPADEHWSAYSELEPGGVSRSIHSVVGDQHFNLVVHRYSTRRWLGRETTLDVPAGESSVLSLLSYQGPRTVDLLVGGRVIAREHVDVNQTDIPLSGLIGPDTHSITLRAETCTPIPKRSNACRAIRILAPTPRHVELFNVSKDPFEQTDLSATRPDLTHRLLRTVMQRTFTVRGAPLVERLGTELKDRLKALGYL
jgi:arylsulfatase A-like enzyme